MTRIKKMLIFVYNKKIKVMLELVNEAYGRVLRLEDEGHAFDDIMDELDEFFDGTILVSIYDKFLDDKAMTDDESKLLIDAFIKFEM